MNNLEITVLIPCYNANKTIERCVESVLKQDYDAKLLKVICIDDGSTDETLHFLKKYRELYPDRFNYSTQPNQGLGKTRYNLINTVTTPYFLFCDADDYLLENAVNNLVEAATRGGEHDITVSKAYRINGKRKSTWWLTKHIRKNMTPYAYLLKNYPYAWNILIKTSFYKSTGFDYSKITTMMEDNILCHYVLIRAHSLGVCKKHTYAFVKNNKSYSSTSTINNQKIAECYANLEYYLSLESNSKSSRLVDDTKTMTVIKNCIYPIMLYTIWFRKKNNIDNFVANRDRLNAILKKFDIRMTCPHEWHKFVVYLLFIKIPWRK